MRRPPLAAVAAAAALCLSTLALTSSASAAPAPKSHGHHNVRVCTTASPGSAACNAIRSDPVTSAGTAAPAVTPAGKTTPLATTVPAGALTAADIAAAYKLPGGTVNTPITGKTVAIVDAYNAPTAEADLGVYRKAMNLPPCTTRNGCFKKVGQTGTSYLPRNDGGWAQEISLDLDMVSAACPSCKILLVEANSASFANLGAAVNTAARLGAVAISNSYGGSDSAAMSAYDHPNIAITASTGDSGYGVQAPASFPSVVAVGGTSLTRNGSTRGWTESAWSGAGSGCSALNAKPTWQTTAETLCNGKANGDVSAVADPNTGVAVYDSYSYYGSAGWMQFGGTSAASPIIASVYAQGPAFGTSAAAFTWANRGSLNDVSGGSNGTCPALSSAWCTAGTGWDGPTGLGTPNGVAAF